VAQRILNLNNKPFNNFEVAAKMRDILSQENPQQTYKVELYNPEDSGQGFVVERQDTAKRADESHSQAAAPSAMQALNEQPAETVAHTAEHERQNSDKSQLAAHIYHPALRTYILHVPLILAALGVVIFTQEVWITVLSELGLKSLPTWIKGSALISGTRLIVGVWTVWLIVTILLNYYGTALVVDERGVTLKKGIITRDETNIRFNEIRTIGLKQGVLDRLLGIGMLEFASSGTDDMDIRFFNIPNPRGVKAEIEAIIKQYRSGL
jgi:membrane protein YdbS with pleckstrin-like domain